MEKESGKDIYRRWLTFETASSLKEQLLQMRPVPHKFDIGAVYSKKVTDRDNIVSANVPFYPVAREFVLDIDMNDYDRFRTCCSGKTVCKHCWKFLACGAKLIDETLRSDFGFEEIFWIFSGRRGIHCWVTDVAAKRLSSVTRSAIAAYLTVADGRLYSQMLPVKGRFLKRAVRVLGSFWQVILRDQDLFFHPVKGNASRDVLKTQLKALCPKLPVDDLFEDFHKNPTHWGQGKSLEFWERLQDELCQTKHHTLKGGAQESLALLIAYFLQPRLDFNVSKDMAHLLKAPFVIHHGTGKICCPILLEEIENFDPSQVVSVAQLMQSSQQQNDEALHMFETWKQIFRDWTALQKLNRKSILN